MLFSYIHYKMSREHHIIYIPGLFDTHPVNRPFHNLAQAAWRKKGFHPHLYLPHWEEGHHFTPKLKGITHLIDALVQQGNIVSLVGQSAGGSAALNAFCERRDKVNGVVNITGRLRSGVNVRPTLQQAARISPAFKESVLLFERENEPILRPSDRKKIMTIRPWFDETVPASTVPLDGATNLVAPIVEHSSGGGFISIVWTSKFLEFLKELNRE